MKWIECASCWAEFRVVSDVDENIQFCPYCGSSIDIEDEEEDYEEDE